MISSRVSLAPLVALAVAASACSGSSPPAANLPSFQDVSSAPDAIQTAARAVVRIETAGELATGSFISATGLLLTNNHVLGVGVCAVEGCYPQLTFLHQRGEAIQQPMQVFAVPVAVDVGLDMALVQIYASDAGAPLATPDYLRLESHTAGSLLGAHVTVVGHPEGNLKKWTAGTVIDSDGDWIWTDAYILPGNSGSPVLDDAGAMVGIVHRGPGSQDLFTGTGANEYSIGTASASLLAAMKAPLPSAMVSTIAATTTAAAVTHDVVFLNARAKMATLADGSTFDVLGALGAACDAGLARTDIASPEDLSSALVPCTDAMMWIECRTDKQPGGVATECPSTADVQAWAGRFKGVNARWQSLNGELALSAVSFGMASLDASVATGTGDGANDLVAALTAAKAPIDAEIAEYLAAFGVASYGGQSTLDYVTHYKSIPDYAIAISDIASAALWMTNDGTMSRDDCVSLLQQLAGDPGADVGSKLYIENVQYNSGLLQ